MLNAAKEIEHILRTVFFLTHIHRGLISKGMVALNQPIGGALFITKELNSICIDNLRYPLGHNAIDRLS